MLRVKRYRTIAEQLTHPAVNICLQRVLLRLDVPTVPSVQPGFADSAQTDARECKGPPENGEKRQQICSGAHRVRSQEIAPVFTEPTQLRPRRHSYAHKILGEAISRPIRQGTRESEALVAKQIRGPGLRIRRVSVCSLPCLPQSEASQIGFHPGPCR